MTRRSRHFGFVLPTPEEEAAIAAGIAADPDTCEATPQELASLRPLAARRGRPPLAQKRPTLNMRVDADVLAAFKATGPGWQTRINALLRVAARKLTTK